VAKGAVAAFIGGGVLAAVLLYGARAFVRQPPAQPLGVATTLPPFIVDENQQ
jgi:hypothetical protein